MVLEPALTRPEVAKLEIVQRQNDKIGWLQENLTIEFSPEAEPIEISLGGDGSPAERTTLLRAVIESYLQNVVNRESEARFKRLEALERLNIDYVDELKAKRKHLRDLAEQFGTASKEALALRTNFAYENRARAEQTLFDLRLKEVEIRTLLDRHKDRDDAGDLEDRLAVVTAQQKDLELERKGLEEEIRSHNASTVDLQTEETQVATLEATSRELAKEIQALKVELSAPPRVTVASWPRVPTGH
jgi:hypothetical protein